MEDRSGSYNPIVLEHLTNPRNKGEMENPDGVGEAQNPVCGDMMRLFIKVKDNRITDAKFLTFGCGAAIASSSMATEMVKGRTIEEALLISNQVVAEALGGLPPAKIHCSVLAEKAIQAAVSDYRPKEMSQTKLKKTTPHYSLELERTADILREIGKKKGDRILVGFAAETDDIINHARKKLNEKNLDLIVVNDVTKPDAGFEVDTNQVKLLFSSGEVKDLPLMSKEEVSRRVIDEVVLLLIEKKRDKKRKQ